MLLKKRGGRSKRLSRDFAPADAWSFEYNLYDYIGASGDVFGLDNLLFDMSAFDAYGGFDWSWNNSILTLSYFATSGNGGGNEVPEPATLAIIGLGLAGLGLAKRRRK